MKGISGTHACAPASKTGHDVVHGNVDGSQLALLDFYTVLQVNVEADQTMSRLEHRGNQMQRSTVAHDARSVTTAVAGSVELYVRDGVKAEGRWRWRGRWSHAGAGEGV